MANASKTRNRNLGVRKVLAAQLKPHPLNWRKHEQRQRDAMRATYDRVGFVGTLLAVERDGELQLIDGHLRADIDPLLEVDVSLLDLEDHEIPWVLATHDAIGTQATIDTEALDVLLADLDIYEGELAEMFSDIIDQNGKVKDAKSQQDEGPKHQLHEDCEYPLVRVFNEKYEYVTIFCRNETDWGALQTILNLDKQKSYKTTGVAVGRMIEAQDFFILWNARHEADNRLPNPQPSESDHHAQSGAA